MKIIVQKFGGTSVATPSHFKNVAGIVSRTKKKGYKVVVVLSAPGDMTDDLINFASGVSSSIHEREMDMLLATGEQNSIALLAMALSEMGVDAVSLTGAQAGIITDGVYGRARILRINPLRILEEIKKGRVVIVAGFQGVDKKGEITTLGRGGSDITAVALAAALKAMRCDIYTDVKGVYTTDPRVVKNARRVKTIFYDEILELASLGAKVLHPRAAKIAKKFELEVGVRSAFDTDDRGTVIKGPGSGRISGSTRKNKYKGVVMEGVYVVGVAADKNQAKVTIVNAPDKPGVASRIFSTIASAHINVDMIVQNVSHRDFTDVSFTVHRGDLPRTLKIVRSIARKIKAADVLSASSIAKVSIVGAGMSSHSGVAARMFSVLGRKKINIDMIGTSEIKLSCIVKEEQAEKAVRALHQEFQLGKKKARYRNK